MSTLGKIAGEIAALFAISFLGILSIFAPKYSDRLYVRMIEWADASD
jgi:hypothetical protein